jgi:hypothetical protein
MPLVPAEAAGGERAAGGQAGAVSGQAKRKSMPTAGQLVQQRVKARAAERAQSAAGASTAAGGKGAGRAQPAAGALMAAGGKAAGRAQSAAGASTAAGGKDKVNCLVKAINCLINYGMPIRAGECVSRPAADTGRRWQSVCRVAADSVEAIL